MVPKKILPVLLGNAFESYDFCLYGLLAVYFSKLFFPESQYSLTFSFLLFSIAYIARPLGSIIWGHVADKYGRKPVLMSTLSLMAIPAIGMAVMPSYESIGITASVLVVLLRFLQGIAFGGEFPTVMVTLYELAPKNRKGLFCSYTDGIAIVGYFIGLLLIIVLKSIFSDQYMFEYGWRIMFAVSIIFILVLGYIRYALVETVQKKKKVDFPFIRCETWRAERGRVDKVSEAERMAPRMCRRRGSKSVIKLYYLAVKAYRSQVA